MFNALKFGDDTKSSISLQRVSRAPDKSGIGNHRNSTALALPIQQLTGALCMKLVFKLFGS